MKQRRFGKTNKMVSEIGLGTWQLGTKWGDPFNHQEAMAILEMAYEQDINFLDTADVYNNGQSEQSIGEILKKYPDFFYVTTKCGRALNPHTAEMYTPQAIEKFVEGSLKRLDTEKLDLILLHCPPTSVYRNDEIFSKLEQLKTAGKLIDYGVSIETVEEGLLAMEYDIAAMEVIFNMFRLKPLDQLFPTAKQKDVGIIARVPLASGLLTGRYNANTVFGKDDHRTFNRQGEAFDKGETFSGVDYQLGLQAVEELKALFGTEDLIPYALRWVLMHDAVSTVIPGASKVSQVVSNAAVDTFPELTQAQMQKVEEIYNRLIRPSVHHLW
ncbi:aldo/keto reductase [Mannheimia sp. AT1]|uniref:Aldo/keto reductase n=1 Tax=Mannheimia cairinae TaxID=3025936 RepID=A0ABT5MQ67_9PAST|nr:aldo/keto reductase [Mannheimia cairinae]MDD0824326.1 aldo/keto reductase [Mannheimia cairinae]MDD0826551.1 aldo/keto reductase [Mannheimia cairinae]